MFTSHEMIDRIRETDRARLYDDVFGAMDYAARQSLLAGHSVIYDAQQTKRENRRNIEKIAHEAGAIPLLVWMKTSEDVALHRGQVCEARDDSHQYSGEKMKMLIERFSSVTDLPEEGENLIEISGELPFEQQYVSFQQQLATLTL